MRAHEYTTPIVDDDRRPSPSHPLCCRLLAGRSSAARGKAVTGQDGAATSGARPIGVARARGKRGGCAVARTTGGAGWVTANVMKIQTIDPLTRPRGDREALTCFCMRMGEQSLTGRTPSPSGSLCAVSLSLFRIAPHPHVQQCRYASSLLVRSNGTKHLRDPIAACRQATCAPSAGQGLWCRRRR